MKAGSFLHHEFVEYIPDKVEDGKLYVSMHFAIVVHNCCCGCGNQVVTPLAPANWSLTFDGETISLDPSIGNWSFECQSHYWIRSNRVRWAAKWSNEKIDAVRSLDKERRRKVGSSEPITQEEAAAITVAEDRKANKTAWSWIKSWFW